MLPKGTRVRMKSKAIVPGNLRWKEATIVGSVVSQDGARIGYKLEFGSDVIAVYRDVFRGLPANTWPAEDFHIMQIATLDRESLEAWLDEEDPEESW